NVRGTSQLRRSRRIKDFGTTSLAVRQGSTSWLIRRSHAMLASMYASCQGRSAPRASSWTPSWVASFAASSRVGALANAIHESADLDAPDSVTGDDPLETPRGHADLPYLDSNDIPRT